MLSPATGGFQRLPGNPAGLDKSHFDGLLVAPHYIYISSLFVLWAICNPFFEIDRSSLIYSATALAYADPKGVGRDLMFVFDGQSGFTLFTPIFRFLTIELGSSQATRLIAAASVVAAFFGAYTLASTMFAGRMRTLAVVFAAALPACYGGYQIFSYAETAATPRPFTEALVFLGLAALLRRRFGLAAAAMALAALLHPIMALPGALVAFCWIVNEDRHWLVPALIVAFVLLCAAAMGVKPFDRLTTIMDPEWRSVLVDRSTQLFPSLWPEGWHGRFAARIATIAIAATIGAPPVRKLLVMTAAVGVGGFVAAYVFDLKLPLVLLLQAQTWRTMWLVFALATMAASICACELWQRGGNARIVLMLLALSWTFADHDGSMVFAAAAVGFHVCLRPGTHELPPRLVTVMVSIALAVIVIGLAQTELLVWASFRAAPADAMSDAQRTLAADWDYTPLALLGAVLSLSGWKPGKETLAAASLCGIVFLAACWDRRSDLNRYFDGRADVSELRRIVDSRPGEVLWVGGMREVWSWLGRPQWISTIQGAGLVFSRDLAMTYRDRARIAIDAGLAGPNVLTPFATPLSSAATALDPAKVHAFCSLATAPAWIVAPLADASHPPQRDLHAIEWTAPVVKHDPVVAADGSTSWRAISTYEIVPCRRDG